jgi:uncharacterized protein (DUF362 family)
MRQSKSIVALVRDNSLPFNYDNTDEIRDLASVSTDKIEKMIERAVRLADINIKRIIEDIPSRPTKIVIKPNVTAEAYPEDLSTTDPRVVLALCRWLRRTVPKKARIYIADNSAFGEATGTRKAMETSMIAAAQDYVDGVELWPLDETAFSEIVPVAVSNPLTMPEELAFKRIFDADYLINVPKMKVLIDYVVSLGLKNWQGIIRCGERWMGEKQTLGLQVKLDQQAYHRADMAAKIADLYKVKRPDLTILDGIWALEGQGPWAGERKIMNLIMASTDTVALDATACRCMGIDPYNEVSHIRTAYHAEIGNVHESEIEVRFEDLGGENQVLPELEDVQNSSIRKVRKHFKRASPDPVGLIENVHLHVGGTCIGCLANIRGGLDNLIFEKFPFHRLEAPVHIIAGLDVYIPSRLDGFVILVGDCTAIRPTRAVKEDGTQDNSPMVDEWGNLILSTAEKVSQACKDTDAHIIYYWGCAPVTIFGELVTIMNDLLR